MTHTDPPPRHGLARGTASARHYSPEELHNADVAHERADVDIRRITVSAIALGAIVAAAFVLMYGLFWWLEDRVAQSDPLVSPIVAPAVQMPPDTTLAPTFGNAPQPQLLTNEPAVLGRQRQLEDQRLTGYGWVDEAGGIAQIPIGEAKKLIVERGLPSRAGGTLDPTLGTVRASRGEASGGRTVSGGR